MKKVKRENWESNSDNQFTAKRRKLQSDYSENVLKEPCGKGPYKNSKDDYSNYTFVLYLLIATASFTGVVNFICYEYK